MGDMGGVYWIGGTGFMVSVVFEGGKYAMMVCEACVNWDSKVDMMREM